MLQVMQEDIGATLYAFLHVCRTSSHEWNALNREKQQVVLRPDERLNKVPLAAAGLSQASLVSSQTTRLAISRPA